MMESKGLSLILLATVANFLLVSCYKEGPPIGDNAGEDKTAAYGVCADMTPQHGTDANKDWTEDKYEIVLNQDCYNADSTIQVQVKQITADAGLKIEGVFIQARSADTTKGESEGEFDADGTPNMKARDCFSKTKNVITHYEDEVDVKNLYVKWTPKGTTTDRTFVATVVMHEHDYSVMLKSSLLTYNADCVDKAMTTNPNKGTNGGGSHEDNSASTVHATFATIAITVIAMLTALM